MAKRRMCPNNLQFQSKIRNNNIDSAMVQKINLRITIYVVNIKNNYKITIILKYMIRLYHAICRFMSLLLLYNIYIKIKYPYIKIKYGHKSI